jgi:hypothetical protein
LDDGNALILVVGEEDVACSVQLDRTGVDDGVGECEGGELGAVGCELDQPVIAPVAYPQVAPSIDRDIVGAFLRPAAALGRESGVGGGERLQQGSADGVDLRDHSL